MKKYVKLPLDIKFDYGIAEDGEIINLYTKQIKFTCVNKDGYLQVAFGTAKVKRTFLVHRLVAESFIPNPENKPQVNHIDGNKLNCHISNLEWVTPRENLIHAFKTGLQKRGEAHGRSKLTEEQVREIRYRYANEKISYAQLSRDYNVNPNSIKRILNGETWTHVI